MVETTMPDQLRPSIREVLLEEIRRQAPTSPIEATLQQNSILNATAQKIGRGNDEAILTEWGELFRTGLIAWGSDLSNPNPPFFHLTERGHRALDHLARDPSNPSGYMRHLDSIASIGHIARSYLNESLRCYVADLPKAAAIMLGCAAERILIDLRDAVVERLEARNTQVPRDLKDWRAKVVTDAVYKFFEQERNQLQPDLREPFDAYWSAFAFQIRSARNEVGHPTSIDPVTFETVHALLLVFPELARLSSRLTSWSRGA